MHRKIGNRGVEYRDDFMDRSSNMEIGLCRYKKGNNNKWTYDHADHLMVDLETIIALAFMTYIANLDAYECHPGDKNFLNDFIDECWVLHYTYDTGGLLFKSIFAHLLLMTIYRCNSFMCTYCLLYLYL
jgi:hypothetical protein